MKVSLHVKLIVDACNYSDDEEEFDIQMERVLGSIYNVTWNTGSLAVENIAYTTVAAMGTVTVHPNQTSILLQLEDSNDCRVNVTVVDKCDREYTNSASIPGNYLLVANNHNIMTHWEWDQPYVF